MFNTHVAAARFCDGRVHTFVCEGDDDRSDGELVASILSSLPEWLPYVYLIERGDRIVYTAGDCRPESLFDAFYHLER